MTYPHQSVLLQEFLAQFEGRKIKFFLDGTLGAGGHSHALLLAHPEIEELIGMDQDTTALSIARERLIPWEAKTRFIQANFRHLDQFNLPKLDGILLDLGVSSMQLDQPEKGFSFMRDGPLDMRMDSTQDLTAEIIVNTWSEKDLGRIFRDFGEEERWRQAARTIVQAREIQSITRTRQLVELLEPKLRKPGKKGIHPLTLIFQALRIAVNKELEVLQEVLPKAVSALNPGGRLAVITFHSLEDRIVKNYFRDAASDKVSTSGIGGIFLDKKPEIAILSRKPIQPSDEEVLKQPRSRSAKMRIVEKL